MTDEDEDRFQIETAFWLLLHANAAMARGDVAAVGFREAASMLLERAGWAGDEDGAAEWLEEHPRHSGNEGTT